MKIDNNLAYLLGFFFAEGNFDKCRICLTQKDKEILVNILNSIQHYGFNYNLSYRVNCFRLRIYSKELRNLFDQLTQHKTSFPDLRDKELNRNLISGFFDGDGGITISGRTLHIFFCQKDIKILEQINNMLQQETNIHTILYPAYNIGFTGIKKPNHKLFVRRRSYENFNEYLLSKSNKHKLKLGRIMELKQNMQTLIEWGEEEDNQLRDYLNKKISLSDIAKKLNRSIGAIYGELFKLRKQGKINYFGRKNFTEEEIRLIGDCVDKKIKYKELFKLLPNRSKECLYQVVWKAKVTHSHRLKAVGFLGQIHCL